MGVDVAMPQKPPEPGQTDVYTLVLLDLSTMSLSSNIAALMRSDIMQRVEYGLKKYGMPLRTFNGRNALVDAYQEELDAAHYYRQLLEETGEYVLEDQSKPNVREVVEGLYSDTMHKCVLLRTLLYNEEQLAHGRKLLDLIYADNQ